MIKFWGFSRGGRGVRELEHVLFLFFGMIFFGSIEEKRDGKTVVKDQVLIDGKPRNNCEMKKNKVRLALKCHNFRPLHLGEAPFALGKSPECGKT